MAANELLLSRDKVRRYIDSDYQQLSYWYHLRKLNPVPKSALPKLGYIVPGVACSHMLQTDSDAVFLDGFISNPEVTREERVNALAAIDERLITDAKGLGYKKVFVFTKHSTIEEECQRMCYLSLGEYKMFVSEIK